MQTSNTAGMVTISRAEYERLQQENAQLESTRVKLEAERIKLEAEAQAEANRILAESVTDALIRYQTIDKWNGQLPQVSLSGSDATPVIGVTLPEQE